MRRNLLLLAASLVGCIILLSAHNVDATPPTADPLHPIGVAYIGDDGIERIPLPPWPSGDGQTVNGLYVPLGPEALQRVPEILLAPADNFCPGADIIGLAIGQIAAGPTDVTNFSISDAAPNLSGCMWGPITGSSSGYRSAWYELTAPITGMLVMQAVPNASFSNDYDTVIAAYSEGVCGNLQSNLLTCNDNYNGFLSRISLQVQEGEKYYFEIVDRDLAASDAKILNLEVWIETRTNWRTDSAWNTTAAQRSRHMTATAGDYIYVAGGQEAVDNYIPPGGVRPFLRTARLSRFHVPTQTWAELAPMPPECAPLSNDGGGGYSNTGMAYISGKLYIPSGFVGNNDIYLGQHCVYDIATNHWSVNAADAPWPGGSDKALGYSSVIADPAGDLYYVVNGITGPFFGIDTVTTASKDIFLYAADFDFWLSSAAGQLPPANTARYAQTGALIPGPTGDSELCVVGGLEPGTTLISPAALLPGGECFNTAIKSWRPIASLNFPRYLAGSAVGFDGTWYVFGGIDESFMAVEEIEAYDALNNRWLVLDYPFNINDPGRAWTQGGVVGSTLTVIGGETQPLDLSGTGGSLVTAEVLQTNIPLYKTQTAPSTVFLPVVSIPIDVGPEEPNDTFETAWPLSLNASFDSNFYDQADRFDVYSFSLQQSQRIEIDLRQIPEGDNFNLFLYTVGRTLLASSQNPNTADESITIVLQPGTYYLMIVAEANTIPNVPSWYWLDITAY